MAGLPKRSLLVLFSVLLVASIAAIAQTDPIDPVLPDPDPVVQTPSEVLQPVIDLVETNLAVTDEEKQALIDQFAELIEGELMTADQAIEMLLSLGWETLDLEEDITLALGLLGDVLSGVTSGEIVDPVAALIGSLNAELTPDGITNAIGKAGASDATLLQAQSLVAAGLPPGIVLRVTKDALRNGLSQEEIDAMLEALGTAYAEGQSPGHAANTATGQSSYSYQEQEQEENANEGENEEPEAEENKNSNGQGNGMDKDKKNENGNSGKKK